MTEENQYQADNPTPEETSEALSEKAPANGQSAAPNRSPTLWPVFLVLAILLWFYTTTGGGQIMVNEMLSEAYDSQAEHLLRGDPGVDGEAIRHESMIVNGKTRMYFGPFPAFVRIPLNFIYHDGRGHWSRITGFCAGLIALGAFMGLVRMFLRESSLSSRWRAIIGSVCLVGFAFGSPLLLLLGNPSIYGEAIIWGLAWSMAAIYFACRVRKSAGRVLTWSLVAFSFCVGAAVLSRLTFGAPLLLISLFLAWPLLRTRQFRNLVALFLPLGIAMIFHFWLSYAKFGNFSGLKMTAYINPTQREFAEKHGSFDLARVPYSFADYFFLRRPQLHKAPPYVQSFRASFNHPDLYVNPFTETYISLLWSSSWILFGAIIGLVLLFRSKDTSWMDRAIAGVFFIQVIGILSFQGCAQRYVAEFFPFLVFVFVLFLGKSRFVLRRSQYVLIALVAVSIVINFAATVSWLIEADMNVPQQTKKSWSSFIGRTR